MGSSNFSTVRTQTIQKRNEQLIKYLPLFQQTIRTANLSTERVEQITRMNISDLVRMLNKRTITSQVLVAIFGFRAGTIGRQFCIITEDYFQYATKKAKQCDQHRAKSGKHNWSFDEQWNPQRHLMPFYGIPISIKDNIDMAGTRTTVGMSCRANRFVEKDCSLIRCIKNSGMIPFVKTNVPQLIMVFDSTNELWGRVLNPWNQKRTPGGSSGGEAAAIAARISPIGIGNDIGGSVRIPASCCGIVSMLPSTGRIPFMGNIGFVSTSLNGYDFLRPMNGPMSRSIDDLAMWTHIATTQSLYQGQNDPYIKLVPFDFKVYQAYQRHSKKLRIGFIENLDFIESTPTCQRAVKQTVQFLTKQGHELIQVQIPNEKQIIQGYSTQVNCVRGMKPYKDGLEGQPLIQEYKMMNFASSLPRWLQNTLTFVLRSSRPRAATFLQGGKTRNTYQYLVSTGRAYQLRQQFIKYWRQLKLDFIVMPGFATQAPNHGASKDGFACAVYTFIWNFLAMNVCSLPITVVREQEQYYESKWNDQITQLLKDNVRDSVGLPVNIQVIGLPFSQEKVLGLAKQIEQHFKFEEKHPYPDL